MRDVVLYMSMSLDGFVGSDREHPGMSVPEGAELKNHPQLMEITATHENSDSPCQSWERVPADRRQLPGRATVHRWLARSLATPHTRFGLCLEVSERPYGQGCPAASAPAPAAVACGHRGRGAAGGQVRHRGGFCRDLPDWQRRRLGWLADDGAQQL